MGRLATADWSVMAESGLTRYLKELRRLPMVEPQEGYLLAKRWREDAQWCTGLSSTIWSSFRFDASLGPGDL